MKLYNAKGVFLGLILLAALLPNSALAQQKDAEIAHLDSRVSRLEHQISNRADDGVGLFLFGAFCALWAQNTGRNPWLWFFLGLFFSVITVLVLLRRNSQDKKPLRLGLE